MPVVAGILFFCLLISFRANAQESLSLSGFRKGEKRAFTGTRVQKDYTNDTLYTVTTFAFAVNLAVVSAGESERTMQWTYTATRHTHEVLKKTSEQYEVANALEYLSRKLFDFQKLNVVYTTDANGAFQELKNLEELRAYVAGVIDAAVAENIGDKNFATVLQQFRPTFLSADYLSYAFIPEVHVYHQLHGVAIEAGEQAFEIELPNPLSGELLPGIVTLTGKKISDTESEVTMDQGFDQDKLTDVVSDKVQQTYSAMGDKADRQPPLQYHVVSRYTLKQHAVATAQQTKTVSSNESTAIEEIILH